MKNVSTVLVDLQRMKKLKPSKKSKKDAKEDDDDDDDEEEAEEDEDEEAMLVGDDDDEEGDDVMDMLAPQKQREYIDEFDRLRLIKTHLVLPLRAAYPNNIRQKKAEDGGRVALQCDSSKL